MEKRFVRVKGRSNAAERNKAKTQLIRVQRRTYEQLDELREKTRLPVTEIVGAMVAAALNSEVVDFKKWRADMPAQGRMTPQQRWLEVESQVMLALLNLKSEHGEKTRLSVEGVIAECEAEGVSKPQVERALQNFKAAGIVRLDLSRNEVWSDDWKTSHSAYLVRKEEG